MANVVNFLFSFVLTTGLFALIYKIMPRVRIRWSEVWMGAAITAILFTIGKFFDRPVYRQKRGDERFWRGGSLVALLVWVYYSAQIFLMGAEFTWAYSHIFGSRKHQLAPHDLIQALDESGADALQSSSEIAKTAHGKSTPSSQSVAGKSGD